MPQIKHNKILFLTLSNILIALVVVNNLSAIHLPFDDTFSRIPNITVNDAWKTVESISGFKILSSNNFQLGFDLESDCCSDTLLLKPVRFPKIFGNKIPDYFQETAIEYGTNVPKLFFTSCSTTGIINIYHIHMYPNFYSHFPYIFHSQFIPSKLEPTITAISPDNQWISQLSISSKTIRFFRISSVSSLVNNWNPVFTFSEFNKKPSIQEYSNSLVKHGTMKYVFPLDNYNLILNQTGILFGHEFLRDPNASYHMEFSQDSSFLVIAEIRKTGVSQPFSKSYSVNQKRNIALISLSKHESDVWSFEAYLNQPNLDELKIYSQFSQVEKFLATVDTFTKNLISSESSFSALQSTSTPGSFSNLIILDVWISPQNLQFRNFKNRHYFIPAPMFSFAAIFYNTEQESFIIVTKYYDSRNRHNSHFINSTLLHPRKRIGDYSIWSFTQNDIKESHWKHRTILSRFQPEVGSSLKSSANFKPTASFSSDGLVLALNVQQYVLIFSSAPIPPNKHSISTLEHVSLDSYYDKYPCSFGYMTTLVAPSIISDVTISTLSNYDVILSINNGLMIYRGSSAPRIYPSSRIDSYYLPPRPFLSWGLTSFPLDMDTFPKKSFQSHASFIKPAVWWPFYKRLQHYLIPPVVNTSAQRSVNMGPTLNHMLSLQGVFFTQTLFSFIGYFVLAFLLVHLIIYPIVAKIESVVSNLFDISSDSILSQITNNAPFLFIVAIFCLSIFENLFDSHFPNDWPAHIHHVFQNRISSHYGLMMHYHGPCTYPAGFYWIYSPLEFLFSSSLQLWSLFWALLEAIHNYLLWKTFSALNVPFIIIFLSIASNRMHLYNVRVVINDFPSVFLMYLAIHIFIFGLKKMIFPIQKSNSEQNLIPFRFPFNIRPIMLTLIGSCLYSFVISTKLNFIFYSPAS